MDEKFMFLPSDLERLLLEGRYQKEVYLMGGRVKVKFTYMQKKEEDEIMRKVIEKIRMESESSGEEITQEEISSRYVEKIENERIKLYIKDEKGEFIYRTVDESPSFIYETCLRMYEIVKARSSDYLFGKYDFDSLEESLKESTGKPSSTGDSISE